MADDFDDPIHGVVARLSSERDERSRQQATNGARGNLIINGWSKLLGAVASDYNQKLQVFGMRFQALETKFGPKGGEGTFVRMTIAKHNDRDWSSEGKIEVKLQADGGLRATALNGVQLDWDWPLNDVFPDAAVRDLLANAAYSAGSQGTSHS